VAADGGKPFGQRHAAPFTLTGTAVRGLRWPPMHAGPRAVRLALQFQLENSQWWPAQELQARQLQQLEVLLAFAAANSPYYRERLAGHPALAEEPLTLEAWRTVPLLTRKDVQAHGERLHSERRPADHGRVFTTQSSGSTGRPVRVRKTQVANHFWKAFAMRQHLWHCPDFSGKLGAIRYTQSAGAVPPRGIERKGWGSGPDGLIETGPLTMIKSSVPVADQADWLVRQDPAYLLTYPSIVLELARHFRREGMRLPGLRQVWTLGEAVGDQVRAACRETFGVGIHDAYSSEEVGYIAVQCPEHEHYHVMSEGVMLEVLDEQDRPCAPGETGRVVLTPLQNLATPLIRYAIGDYAEVGEPCPCGRGLPVVTRIHGRVRNMARLPDGRVIRPSVGITDFEKVAKIEQAQIVQKEPDRILLRLVAPQPLDARQQEKISKIVRENLAWLKMRVEFEYLDEIKRGARDKFEDFVSEVPAS